MFECQHYNTFAEKTAELKNIFGQWPPPFDPVWAVQVSQGRCGSNELWRIVSSFFENTIGEPVYEAMDHPDASEYQNVRKNPIPKPGKNYLYYNVFSKDPQRLHFPVFFWHLQNSPKIVHLTREDHLMRAISIYYANLVTALPTRDKDPNAVYKVYGMPIDISRIDEYIKISMTEIEIVKQLVSEFVSEDRLLRISHYDLYHANSFNTIRDIMRFLECELQNKRVSIGAYKETNYERIPNRQEVMDRYRRDFAEQKHWIPEDIDSEAIENEISETVEKHIRLNVSTSEFPKKTINFVLSSQKRQESQFDLKANQKFYIDEIPKSAKYVSPVEFSRLPNIKRNIYMLDNRWMNFDTEIPSHIREFFEVTDIQENHVSENCEWICGFSVFFLKARKEYEHAEHRCSPEAHTKLIEGVNQLTNYHDRCPKTLLRFYVSPEVWERLTEEDILYRPGTEFYKMQFDSEESQLGTIWRMLALFDKTFEWAIQADCGPDEDWILARIAHWSREEFKAWLNSEFYWGGEMLLWEHNWHPAKNESFIKEGEQVWGNIDVFDFLSGGGIVTRPAHMPPVEQVVHRYIAERPFTNNFYHAGADVWSSIRAREDKIPYGWEGFGFDQEIWRFLKKEIPVRHLIHSQSTDHMRKVDIPEDHMTKRIISQLISEGSEFVDIKTQEPIFNLI